MTRSVSLGAAMLAMLAGWPQEAGAQPFDPPADHTLQLGVPGVFTAKHKPGTPDPPGYPDPRTNDCASCHGADLKGGAGGQPSCYLCHGALWDATQPQYPDSHTHLILGNSHTPRQADCAFCHNRPEGPKTRFYHAPGHGTPLASGCTQCHGTNLDGTDGIAFSCRWCHDRLWAGQGPPADHTVLKGDVAWHKPGYLAPLDFGCTQCHGPNLNDGFAPSCFSCHGPGGGPPADHTEVKGGFAKHKLGYDDPYANGCTACHGPNLNDGYATSCFECHGPGGSGLPATHTVQLSEGAVSAWHHEGYKDVEANQCDLCHGADLRGGVAPSCYTCHRREWADHDFSNEPWLPSVESQCFVCHLPPSYNGGTDSNPVWNHELPTQQSGYFTVTSSTIAAVGQPQGTSAKCMGCHEGAPDGAAINDFGGNTGGTEYVTGGEAFGRDLRQHHPVSFTFDSGLASLHGGLHDPATTPSGLSPSGTIAQDMLDAGQLECTTCHDPHDYRIGQFLIKPASGETGLCFTCHKFENPDPLQHHIPGRDDPWGDDRGTDFNCTMCHGQSLDGDGQVPACTDCHNDFVFPDAPMPGHHGGDRNKPYFDCAVCHADPLTGVVTGNRFGQLSAPSCYGCHDELWNQNGNGPPEDVAMSDLAGTVGQAVAFDASAITDPDEDPLAYEWLFGDGSQAQMPSHDPVTSHTYDEPGLYHAALSVTDGVNPPAVVAFDVVISQAATTVEDHWTVTTTHPVPETFGITFEDRNGSLVATKDDGALAFGIEFTGVIFWMDLWMDLSGNAYWGTGDMYFGNIDRSAGTMSGVVFDDQGGAYAFTGEQL